MNFLSHFYLDRNTEDSMFIVGSVTPDLMSIYNSEVRIKHAHLGHFHSEEHPQVPLSFVSGLQRHFFVDRIFHSSEHFKAETQRISRELQEWFPQQAIPRKFFIGHLLLELLLDKILIDTNPGILESFYSHFSQSTKYPLIEAATAEVSGHDLPRYQSFLRKFYQNKYLYQYQRYDHLVFVLSHILRRVNIVPRDFLEGPRFVEYMKEYESGLALRHQVFFDEIVAAQE